MNGDPHVSYLCTRATHVCMCKHPFNKHTCAKVAEAPGYTSEVEKAHDLFWGGGPWNNVWKVLIVLVHTMASAHCIRMDQVGDPM